MDYITIIKGDDTNFLGDQFVVVNFNTTIDLSGFTATFSLGDVTLTYGNLSGKTFEIILSSEITSNLAIGKQYGELKLIDTNNRIRTITSVIPFIVKQGVTEEITFVNNSLTISMTVNDTVIDIYVETSGISRTEADRILLACNEAKQAAQNHSNTAQNTLIELNETITEFNNNLTDTNELIDEATEQAEIAIEKAQEVNTVLNSSAKKDFSNLADEAIDKINQSKALETGNVSTDETVYNQIAGYKQASTKSGIDVIEKNYTIPEYANSEYNIMEGEITVENGITNGLYYEGCYVTVPVEIPSTNKVPFHIHIETIIKSIGNSYVCISAQNALCMQSQPNGSLFAYLYASDYNTKMLSTNAITVNIGDKYIIDVGYNDTDGFYSKATCNNQTSEASSDIGDTWIREAIQEFWYGKTSHSYDCCVEVDLVHSYFEVDNTKIRPLFQIPYVESPTGSKIVDVEYREFVQELYENNGAANYYTIDEDNENFTLPMGEIYGLISKSTKSSASGLSDKLIAEILDAIAPDNTVIVKLTSLPTSSSPYTTNCAGWYVINAETTTQRDLYINQTKTTYCISSNNMVSVFLAKGDSIYWSGNFTNVNSQNFIPARGCKYEKTDDEILADILG